MANNKNTKKKGLAATANPSNTINPNFNDNSAFNQCSKLINYLLEHTSITSKESQQKLDIYYAPARIFTLRANGYLINTVWDNWTSEYGIKHRIARYVLTQKQTVETINNCEVA